MNPHSDLTIHNNSATPQASDNENVDFRPQLRTDRLLLRPFQLDDAVQLERLINDRLIAFNTCSIDYPYLPGQGTEWIGPQADLWRQGKSAVFAICTLDANELMGAIGLEINEIDQRAELGFWLGQGYRQQGYCREAARAVVEYGLTTLALNKIQAQYFRRNPASGKVLQKIGMQREGLLRRHRRKWGVFEDVIVCGMLAGDLANLGPGSGPSG